jgi:hypothetical protein
MYEKEKKKKKKKKKRKKWKNRFIAELLLLLVVDESTTCASCIVIIIIIVVIITIVIIIFSAVAGRGPRTSSRCAFCCDNKHNVVIGVFIFITIININNNTIIIVCTCQGHSEGGRCFCSICSKLVVVSADCCLIATNANSNTIVCFICFSCFICFVIIDGGCVERSICGGAQGRDSHSYDLSEFANCRHAIVFVVT